MNIDDQKKAEILLFLEVYDHINPNPLPWSHFCQNDFIFLFMG